MRHILSASIAIACAAPLIPAAPQFVEPDARAIHVLHGEGPDQFGYEAANAGDVDADGVCDLVVGAPHAAQRAGRFYVYSGRTGELLYVRNGERRGSWLGWSVASAGDADGDGRADVVIGEPYHLGVGRVLLFKGDQDVLVHEWKGEGEGDKFGDEVETAGDWNGDGHADVVVGASMHGRGRGKVYVFSGADGALLLSLVGEADGDRFGSSVAGHVDANRHLLVVGAPMAGDGGRGRVYVFGADGERAFSFDAEKSGVDLASHFVSVVGDVDGDGSADVYASDWKDGSEGPNTGRIYLYSGATGSRLWTLAGARSGDAFGIGNARAGDVDDDGRADLIVGSWLSSRVAPRAGKASLLRGSDGSVLRQWTCTEEGATFGYDATGLGDVDGDGQIDFLVSGAEANAARGRVWVLAGAAVDGDAAGAAPDPLETPRSATSELELQRARELIRGKQFDEATRILRAVTEREPENAGAWYLLGYALHAGGDLDAALPAHAKAAEFPATRAAASYNAACAWSLQGDRERSFEWLRKAVEAGFDNPELLRTDPELDNVRADARFVEFLPRKVDPDQPWREPTRILHAWSGESPGDQFGWEATRLGDLDADGVSDVIVSAPFLQAEGTQVGRVYVYSGKSGEEIRRHTGREAELLGFGIAAAGDVDGDGTPDYVAGAPGAASGQGQVTVWSGRDGSVILSVPGERSGDRFGENVSPVGDVDGDGRDDVAVGAPQHDGKGQDSGRAYVLSGKRGDVLLRLDGQRAGDRFGSAVGANAGGPHHLLVVGAMNAGEASRGVASVFRLGARESPQVPAPLFEIHPAASGANLGQFFVSVVGDVDADGVPDVYASDFSDGSNPGPGGEAGGRIYVHSGRDGARLWTLAGQSPGEGFGIGKAACGDVDGDGHADLIVGAWTNGEAAPGAGKAYLISGAEQRILRTFTCQVHGSAFGFDAIGMGDTDGDGATDFLLTAAYDDQRRGRVYLIAGE